MERPIVLGTGPLLPSQGVKHGILGYCASYCIMLADMREVVGLPQLRIDLGTYNQVSGMGVE